MSELLRLNLGCGQNKLPGYINVDKYGDPDLRHDLEVLPWPFATSTVREVQMNHVLEHIGERSSVFLAVMKELYRVCAPNCMIYIVVPHPRHDDFLGDPTHVRPVTPRMLELFSMRNCLEWARMGVPNSPLASYLGVDFELRQRELIVEVDYWRKVQANEMSQQELLELVRERNNIGKEWRMSLEVVKPPRS